MVWIVPSYELAPRGTLSWNDSRGDVWMLPRRLTGKLVTNEVGGSTISFARPSHLPYRSACSTHGNMRSRPRSMPHEVLEYSGPSLAGFHSSRCADRAKDRRPTDGPRTSSRYRCCKSRGPA